MIKIIQITGDSSSTGAPSHIFRLSKELKKRNFNVIIVAPKGPLLKKAHGAGIKTFEVKMDGLFDRKSDHEIRNIIIKEQPRIVHCHGTRGGWLGRLAARKVKNVKVVYTEHLWTKYFHLPNFALEQFQLNGLKFMERWTDKIIAVSKTVEEFLIAKGFSKDKVVIIPNGVDPQFLSADLLQKPDEAPLVIGSIGSLNQIKNHRNAILAVAKIKKKYPNLNFHYQIIGEGPEEKRLKNLVKSKKVDHTVHIYGRVNSVAERLQHFSIFLNISLSESFGLAVGEAMAVGLPVVASDIDTLKWLVTKECGVFVNPRSPDDIAAKIEKLLFDKNLRTKLGQAGKKRIAAHFTEQAMVDKTVTVYKQLLSR